MIKIEERRGQARFQPKDGLDVLRLLQAIDTAPLAEQLADLSFDPLSRETTLQVIGALRDHGTDPNGPLATSTAQAIGVLADTSVAVGSLVSLVEDLLLAYDPMARIRGRRSRGRASVGGEEAGHITRP
jgi:hypothetical protein